MKHPIQPIEEDEAGTLRFVENKIISALLEYSAKHGYGLNEIARGDFCQDDRDQLNQLIGYSVSNAPISDEAYAIANNIIYQVRKMRMSFGRCEWVSSKDFDEVEDAVKHHKTLKDGESSWHEIHVVYS